MADLTARQSIALVFAGLAIFVLGYAIFFTNRAIQITPTGVGNRTSNAAALGVAISAVGMLGLIAAAFPRAVWRRVVFGGLIAAYAAAGFFVVATLSSFWIDAYTREQEIIVGEVPPPPPRRYRPYDYRRDLDRVPALSPDTAGSRGVAKAAPPAVRL